MTKLILILVLAALQNPPPASGVNESNAPQEKPKTEQASSNANDSQAKSAVTVANDNAPSSQESPGQDTNKGNDKPLKKWWLAPEWVTIFLTAGLIFVGTVQCIIYWLQWHKMRESSERGLRAYVGVVNPVHNVPDVSREEIADFPNSYSVFVKNGGQTPAYNVTAYLQWQSFEGNDSHWPDDLPFIKADIIRAAKNRKRGSATILGSGEMVKSKHTLSAHKDGIAFADAFEKFKKREVSIFLYGVVTYEDIYRKKRSTNFCSVLRHIGANEFTSITYDRNNEAD